MRTGDTFSDDEMRNANSEQYDRAVQAANSYYVEKKTMDAMAREMRTSRATVSRLLSYARAHGIVEIKVFRRDAHASHLAQRLTETYGVESVVVSQPERAPMEERHARTAERAAAHLHRVVTSDTVLAVAWGTMVNAISSHLRPKAVTNCRVVQVNGIGNSTAVGVHYAHGMMDRYGHAFGASVQQRPLPLFFDSAELLGALAAERLVSQATHLIENADIFLFSIGTVSEGVPSSPHLYGNYIDAEDFHELQEDGAVGDIATTFFDAQGDCPGIRLNSRTSGPDLTALRSIRRRICAVSGVQKIAALRAALIGGHVTDLVIDEHTAQAMIDAYADT